MWKLPTFSPVGDARDLVDRAVVASLHLVRILNDLVDEVAEVQHEIELVFGRGALILEDHPPIRVELAFIDTLAADEGEVHAPRIVGRWRCHRSADAAAISLLVDEAIPVLPRRLEPADQHAGRPVGGGGHRRRGLRNDTPKGCVLGNLDGQQRSVAAFKRTPCPEDDAVRIRITRSDSFGKEVAPFFPLGLRSTRRAAPRERRTDCCRKMDEVAAAERHALLVHIRLRVFHLGQPNAPYGDASSHLYEVSGKLGKPTSCPPGRGAYIAESNIGRVIGTDVAGNQVSNIVSLFATAAFRQRFRSELDK